MSVVKTIRKVIGKLPLIRNGLCKNYVITRLTPFTLLLVNRNIMTILSDFTEPVKHYVISNVKRVIKSYRKIGSRYYCLVRKEQSFIGVDRQ